MKEGGKGAGCAADALPLLQPSRMALLLVPSEDIDVRGVGRNTNSSSRTVPVLSTAEAATLPGDGGAVPSSSKGSVRPLIAVATQTPSKGTGFQSPSQSSTWGQLGLQPWPPPARGQAVSKDGWSCDANSSLGF